MTDDQRADSASCMTRLQKLVAARGVTFTRSYATTPLCCPGRSSVLTGRYAHNHGVRTNGDTEEGDIVKTPGAIDFQDNGNERVVFARWLRAAGYRTGYFGKYLNGYSALMARDATADGWPSKHVPAHWDEWHVFSEALFYNYRLIEREHGQRRTSRNCYLSARVKDAPEVGDCRRHADRVVRDGRENFSTDLLKEKIIAFLRRAASDKAPFLITFAPKAPHAPFTSPARYQPDPQQAVFSAEALARVGACPLFEWRNRPASFLESDLSDKPEWVSRLAGGIAVDGLDRIRKLQLVSLLAVEDAIVEILGELDSTGLASNTVVVFTSDNGYGWGEHWWDRKNCAYEICGRVPLIVFDPRHPQEGRQDDALVLNVDLAPTFAALGGAAVGAPQDGMSLVGLLRGEASAARRERLLLECWGGPSRGGAPGVHTAIRTDRWKYIVYYADSARTAQLVRQDGKLERELYDLRRDPDELDNLARRSAAELAARGYAPGEVEAVQKALAPRLKQLEVK